MRVTRDRSGAAFGPQSCKRLSLSAVFVQPEAGGSRAPHLMAVICAIRSVFGGREKSLAPIYQDGESKLIPLVDG